MNNSCIPCILQRTYHRLHLSHFRSVKHFQWQSNWWIIPHWIFPKHPSARNVDGMHSKATKRNITNKIDTNTLDQCLCVYICICVREFCIERMSNQCQQWHLQCKFCATESNWANRLIACDSAAGRWEKLGSNYLHNIELTHSIETITMPIYFQLIFN